MISRDDKPKDNQQPHEPFTAVVSSFMEPSALLNWSCDTKQVSEFDLVSLPTLSARALTMQRDTLDDPFAASFPATRPPPGSQPQKSTETQLIRVINARMKRITELINEELSELDDDNEQVYGRAGGRGTRDDGGTVRWLALRSNSTGEYILPDLGRFVREPQSFDYEKPSSESFERFSTGEARLLLCATDAKVENQDLHLEAAWGIPEYGQYQLEPSVLVSTDCHNEALAHFLEALRTPTTSFLHFVWQVYLHQFLMGREVIDPVSDFDTESAQPDAFRIWSEVNLVIRCERIISDPQEEACVLRIAPSEDSDGRFERVFQDSAVYCTMTTLTEGDCFLAPRFRWSVEPEAVL